MIKIAKLSFAHVHARGYANQIRENSETELVAVWDAGGIRRQTGCRRIQRPILFGSGSSPSRGRTSTPLSLTLMTSDHPRVMIAAAGSGQTYLHRESPRHHPSMNAIGSSEAVEKAGVKFMISLPSRCNPDLVLAKKALDDGLLGDLTFGRGRVAHSAGLDKWFKGPSLWFGDAKRAGGGALFDLGCHRVDIIRWLMGELEERHL